MIKENFGIRLKKLRVADGMSQVQLGENLGLSKQSISSYEKGLSFPTHDGLLYISNFFNVSTDYLYCKVEFKNYSDYYDKSIKAKRIFDLCSQLSEKDIDTITKTIELWVKNKA